MILFFCKCYTSAKFVTPNGFAWHDNCFRLIIFKKVFPDSSVGEESTCNAGRPHFNSWIGKIHWKRDRLPTPVFLGFPCSSTSKESAWNAGDLSSIPGFGRSLGEGKGYQLQNLGLENSTDCIVHGDLKELDKTE